MGWGEAAAPRDRRTALIEAGKYLARRVRIFRHIRTTKAEAAMFDALDRYDEAEQSAPR